MGEIHREQDIDDFILTRKGRFEECDGRNILRLCTDSTGVLERILVELHSESYLRFQ